MSMPLTGQEGFFVRQGQIIGEYNRVAAFYGSDLTNGFLSIWSQFASSDQAAVQNLPDTVTSFRASDQSYLGVIQQDGALASVLQVGDYQPVVPATLQQSFILTAAQMRTSSDSIQRATITATVTPDAGNLGDTVVALSYTNEFGDPIDTTFAETITTTCINSQTSFSETLNAVGTAQVPSYSYLWPAGSGANVPFAVLNPASNAITTDGGFATWGGTGANDPTNWDIVDGAAGVTVFQSAGGGVRAGTNAAQLTSDGAQATQLAQTITLSINTVYMATFEAKVSATGGAGTVIIQITDGDGNVLTDDAGNSLTYSRNFTSQVTTAYQIFTVFFSTPRQLPTTTRVEVGYGVADTSGRSLFLDLVGIVAATRLYPGGPFVAAVSGENPTALADTWACVFTNDQTSQSFAMGMQRLYNTMSLGVYFPSASSPTISNNLVSH